MIVGITISGTMAFELIQQNISVLSNEQSGDVRVALLQQSDIKNEDFQLLPVREGLSEAQIVESGQHARHLIFAKNTGTTEAYIRVAFAIPASLDTANAEGKKALHVIESSSDKWSDVLLKQNVTVNGVVCNVYLYTYAGALAAGAETQDSPISGFYLDSAVTNSADGYFLGNTRLEVSEDGKFNVPAAVQALNTQSAGSASEAFSTVALPTFQPRENQQTN